MEPVQKFFLIGFVVIHAQEIEIDDTLYIQTLLDFSFVDSELEIRT